MNCSVRHLCVFFLCLIFSLFLFIYRLPFPLSFSLLFPSFNVSVITYFILNYFPWLLFPFNLSKPEAGSALIDTSLCGNRLLQRRLPLHKVNSNDSILCSFDICSLFTNVPLAETIEICTKTLYDGHLPTPVILKHVFIELMKTATTSVEFSFNNIMYRQIDGVAMGSPLGPALENIFVGYNESKLFNKISKPTVHCHYVDDTFSLFYKETEFQKFLNCLNLLHPSLKFTNEIETNNSLPFFDVQYFLPNLIINSSLQSIESPLLQVNIFIGIPLDQNNVKQISLIL